MKIVEFAESHRDGQGAGMDVARIEVNGHVIALAVVPGNSMPYLVKINGHEYQSLKTTKKAGKFFDKVWRKLEKA